MDHNDLLTEVLRTAARQIKPELVISPTSDFPPVQVFSFYWPQVLTDLGLFYFQGFRSTALCLNLNQSERT